MEPGTGYWAAALEAAGFDLVDWQDAFRPPGEMHIVDRPEGPVLRAPQFDAAKSAKEVFQQAKTLLPQLNAIMAVTQGTEPVRLAGVVEIEADGTYRRHAFAEAQPFNLRVRTRISRPVVGQDGNVVIQPPQPSRQQQWIALAQGGDPVAVALREALNFVSRGDNWFDLYKAYECLKEVGLLRGLSDNKIVRFTHTANHYHRHPYAVLGQGQPPPRPMSIEEATSLVRGLVERAFQEEAKRRAGSTP